MIERTLCAICGHDRLKTIKSLTMPVSMACLTKRIKYRFEQMTFCACSECNAVQLKNLIEPEDLYINNHNYYMVGETWQRHMEEFAAFCRRYRPYNVLEIGSPDGRLFSMVDRPGLDSWKIYEQNPSSNPVRSRKLEIVRDYFSELTSTRRQYDTVILSHVLEHFYNPRAMLLKFHDLLCNTGRLIISFPDMGYVAENGLLPPFCMNFEHTYFLDIFGFIDFIQANGFKVQTIDTFRDHSIFLYAEKSDRFRAIDPMKKANSRALYYFLEKLSKDVAHINRQIKGQKCVYLYGAHFSSQYLIQLGLDASNVVAILDNSKSKQNHYLYGTGLYVKSPLCLKGKNNPVVICRMGIYTEEITRNILSINPGAVVI